MAPSRSLLVASIILSSALAVEPGDNIEPGLVLLQTRARITSATHDSEVGDDMAMKADAYQNQTRWLSCTYNWSTVGNAHQAHLQWPWTAPWLAHFRESEQVEQMSGTSGASENVGPSQSIVMKRLAELLDHAGRVMDKLGLNWYLAEGSAIGFLRSRTFIPWDADVDVLLEKNDTLQLYNWVSSASANVSFKLPEQNTERASHHYLFGPPRHWPYQVGRTDPNNSKFVVLAAKDNKENVKKILWIDLETELGIDFCLDCNINGAPSAHHVDTQRVMFGSVHANVAKNSFQPKIISVAHEGVFYDEQTIGMALDMPGWACKWFACDSEPKTTSSVASIDALYRENSSAMLGPFDFVAKPSSHHMMCTLPRKFDSCVEVQQAATNVLVDQCQSDR